MLFNKAINYRLCRNPRKVICLEKGTHVGEAVGTASWMVGDKTSAYCSSRGSIIPSRRKGLVLAIEMGRVVQLPPQHARSGSLDIMLSTAGSFL